MTKAIRKNATKKIAAIFQEVNTLNYYTLSNYFIADAVEATDTLKENLMNDIFNGNATLRVNEEGTQYTLRYHSNLWITFTTEEEAAEEVAAEEVEEEVAAEEVEEAAAPVEEAPKAIYFLLGYIGHKAEKLQTLFDGYSNTPNKYGRYLAFENTTYIGNKGVMVSTNCFENEEHFNEMLQTKLLFAI
jgi:hypothetical protein